MSTLSSIAMICFIFLAWNQMIDGLACYSCSNCNDPFNPTYVQVLYQNDSIAYYCSKTSIAFVTSRSLVPTCTPYGTSGNGEWCCRTNLCNGAEKNMLTNAFNFGISILMFTIFF